MLSRADVEGSFVFENLSSSQEIVKGELLAVDRQELQSTMLLLYSIDPSVCIIEIGKSLFLPPTGEIWKQNVHFWQHSMQMKDFYAACSFL